MEMCGLPGRSAFVTNMSVTNVTPRPSCFVEIILVMIKKMFLAMFGVSLCLDQTLLFLTIEAVYRRHNRQHAFL